jgi:hypothetical protein
MIWKTQKLKKCKLNGQNKSILVSPAETHLFEQWKIKTKIINFKNKLLLVQSHT